MHSQLLKVAQGGERLDVWLSHQLPDLSRSRIQALIKAGLVQVNDKQAKPHHKVAVGEQIAVTIPAAAPAALIPEAIPLDILHEDADLIVVNKPAGLVVHPAAGHAVGTLANALLHHCHDLEGIGGELRPGIVHRLDKDTSGVMVAAKNDRALNSLVAQFKAREIKKEYLAVVWGRPQPPAGRAATLIGRSPRDRKKMAVTPRTGRPAVTLYETLETFAQTALLKVRIETGRTHQIRVHLAHLGHPVVGDTQYGRKRAEQLPAPVARQMLHAARLTFRHPRTGAALQFDAPLPPDLRALLTALRSTIPRPS